VAASHGSMLGLFSCRCFTAARIPLTLTVATVRVGLFTAIDLIGGRTDLR